MTNLPLARRSFFAADQDAFAALSGDWNPLHTDPIVARRTLMGAPVVHGIHLVAWALDRWLAESSLQVEVLSLQAMFRKPAYLEQEVRLELTHVRAGVLDLRATTRDGNALELTVEYRETTARRGDPVPVPHARWTRRVAADELSLGDAATASGVLEIAIDPAAARTAFPAFVDTLGEDVLAELLAMTRLVGMRCPGLNSLFGGFALAAHHQAPGAATLAFHVASAKPSYSMITLRVRGPALAGTLQTFYRPVPRDLPMATVERVVERDAFRDQRAIIIGGSRGLGSAFAKVIAAGGGQVCLTYHRGAEDAAVVVDAIRARGFTASAMPYDVLAPDREFASPFTRPPTHLYYLATPTLFAIRKGAPFRADELTSLVSYYVTGLHAAVTTIAALGVNRLTVWAPSTTMLDAPSGALAYCAAKAAMEELARQLPALLPVDVHVPRIGRLDTDQTASLIELPPAPTLDVALEHAMRIR